MYVLFFVPWVFLCPNSVLQILPPPGVSLEAHFAQLAEVNPWSKFEERVSVGYLSAVVSTQSQPVLTQVRIHSTPFVSSGLTPCSWKTVNSTASMTLISKASSPWLVLNHDSGLNVRLSCSYIIRHGK